MDKRCSWVGLVMLLTACGADAAMPADGPEMAGSAAMFAGGPAPSDAAGHAAPEVVIEPPPAPVADAGAPADVVEPTEPADAGNVAPVTPVEPVTPPQPMAGSGSAAAGSGGSVAPVEPVKPAPVETVLCMVSAHAVATYAGTDSSLLAVLSAGAADGSGISLPSVRVLARQPTVSAPSPIFSTDTTVLAKDWPLDIHDVKGMTTLSIGWDVPDSRGTSTGTASTPCTLAAGDQVTSYHVSVTLNINNKHVDVSGEVHGFKAQ